MNHRKTTAAFFLVSSLFLASSPAVAQTGNPTAQAGVHFRGGVAAFTRGEYSVALSEFQSAYRIAPHHAVRVNIANCYMHLGRPIDALNHFESFLSEAAVAGPINRTQRAEVDSQIAELRHQVGEVQVRIEPTSVRDPIVVVDGQTADARGLVRMMPGRHTVEVSADGFSAGRQDVTVTAGQQSTVAILLRPSSAGAATTTVAATTTTATAATTAATTNAVATSTNTTTSPRVEPGPTTTTATGTASISTNNSTGTTSTGTSTDNQTQEPLGTGLVVGPPPNTRRGPPLGLLIGSAVGTGVVAIGWGVFGGLSIGANGEFNRYARQVETNGSITPTEMSAASAAASRARTFALVSDVMLGLTIAGAAATTVLFIVTPRGAAQEQPRVALVPVVSPQSVGLSLGGTL